MDKNKKIEQELLSKLMKLSEDNLLKILKKCNINIGKWSPPYDYEEKLYFATKIIERIPFKRINSYLKSDKTKNNIIKKKG